MTYRQRPFLSAVVGPRAAWIILRELGSQLDGLAARGVHWSRVRIQLAYTVAAREIAS